MRRYLQIAGRVIGIAGLGVTAAATSTHAQLTSPSQVTPQSLRPAVPPDAGVQLLGQSSQPAPARAAELDVLIGTVVVEGNFDDVAPQLQPLIAPLRGRRVTVAQIYAVAQAMEHRYGEAGYALVRVVVPPQKLVDRGLLRLVVVDGFIEQVDVAAVPERVRAVVAARIDFLVGRRRLRLSDIERGLLIAGDVPGLKLRSTLVRGVSPGATRLVLDGQHRLVTGSIGGDNRLSPSLGTWQLRGAMAVNSALGIGEQVYGTAGLGADLNAATRGNAPLAVYGGGVVIPLGTRGFTVNPEYTHSTTQTPLAPGVPATIGLFERFAARLRDQLIWTRGTSLNLNLSLEYVSQQVQAPAFGIALNLDRYAVVRFGPDYAASLPWGAGLQLGASFSQGLGGRTEADAASSGTPLSRSGAVPDFSKLAANVRVSQPLPGQMRFDLIGFAQTSFSRPLLRSEQFSLDGPDAVSAFASGTFSVDQGATLRGELARPLSVRFETIHAAVSPYVFGSAGRGWLLDVSRVEQPVIDAAAIGVGMRGNLETADGSPGFNLGLEAARQFTNVVGARQGWRGNINATVAF